MTRATLAIGCLLLLLGSCSGPTEVEDFRAEFRTDRHAYSHGEEVVRTLTNTGEAEIGIRESCFAELERRVNGTWKSLGFGEDAVCLLRDRGSVALAPGEVWTDTFTVSDSRYEPGGIYRFLTLIREGHGEDQAKAVRSNSFTITEQVQGLTTSRQHRLSVGVREEGDEEAGRIVHSNAFEVTE